ncbi:disease resistance protein RUN1-like [Telopea speciosissima]|uniref:disease resistance protein RUN1-like n=1 Tax=Telopea speciosissima TaxID=54955 RepID=UPI001CC61FA4|nr:disease resistance protein RUN1-like [Telopea speciosissima]
MSYGASSSSRQWKYDVFLSFCGQDTRTNFTDHLFNWLDRDGIRTFRDDKELNRGEDIPSELTEAIEGCRIAIIVFSENYASSTWCLNELVKILDCKKDGRMEKVLPVFYKMNPSDVRKQSNTYTEAFMRHEERFMDEMGKVETWRASLKEAANMSGWDQRNVANGHEAELIKKIGEEVLTILKPTCLDVAEHPIGLESHIERISCLLNDGGLNVVRIVGICGPGGIGKTTIAKAVFNVMFSNFEGSCFLANVREVSRKEGFVFLQKQLLSGVLKRKAIDIDNEDQGIITIRDRLCKRVLIVLDDVDDREQFYRLVGGHDSFVPGSRIILTTRDEHSLNGLDVDEKYKYRVKTMNPNESLQLFSHHAFRQNHPSKGYEQLSNMVVDYAGGLPLALKVLGSHLYNRFQVEWETELENLRRIPDDKIFKILEISYNGLHSSKQTIFLDISCFFIGEKKDFVITILDACGLGGEAGIKLLIERSLVTIDEDNMVCMHDLIRDMGREIVRRQSFETPGRRSRLWDSDDAIDVLINLTGTDAVKGLQLHLSEYNVNEFNLLTIEGFSKMPNLRLLSIDDFSFNNKIDPEIFLQERVFCFRNLVWLSWEGFPFEYIPNNFHLRSLVILDIQNSKLKEVWKGTKCFTKLKELKLSYSRYLTHTPDFSGLPNLEKLVLSCCTSLIEVHESVNSLKKLVHLDLKFCCKLRNLPNGIAFCSKLETLNVCGCNFELLPMLPSSLHCLRASNCLMLERLPNLSNLKQLLMLDLSGCTSVTEIEGFEGLKSATTIDLNGCFNLKSCVKERIFQVGNHNVCEVFVDWTEEVPKLVGFEFESESSSSDSLTCQVTHNNQQEGLILCIAFSTWKYEADLMAVVHNNSKNFTWRYGFKNIRYSSWDASITWVIKIPNCVWKSIAEYGDTINVSVLHERDHPPYRLGKFNKVKKIGVHFF